MEGWWNLESGVDDQHPTRGIRSVVACLRCIILRPGQAVAQIGRAERVTVPIRTQAAETLIGRLQATPRVFTLTAAPSRCTAVRRPSRFRSAVAGRPLCLHRVHSRLERGSSGGSAIE